MRVCGAMDNAPDYGSGDSRFDSWQARNGIITKKNRVVTVILLNTKFQGLDSAVGSARVS